MISKEESFETISQEITKNHLELTALIQDIQQCIGPLEFLNELNAEGRVLISSLRQNIKKLEEFAERERVKQKKEELQAEIDNYRGQLNAATSAFGKANIVSACAIDKMSREELLSMTPEQETLLRKRKDKQSAANMSSQMTERLLDISKNLAQTTERSAETLDTLITSSEKVSSTKNELEHQQQVIVQSGKLLGKYGRREITDKALVFLAFMFFLAVVFYIIQKRLF